jgi:hypothetical protein
MWSAGKKEASIPPTRRARERFVLSPFPGFCWDIRESWGRSGGGVRAASFMGKTLCHTRQHFHTLWGIGLSIRYHKAISHRLKRFCGSSIARDPLDPLLLCRFSTRGAPPFVRPVSITGFSSHGFPGPLSTRLSHPLSANMKSSFQRGRIGTLHNHGSSVIRYSSGNIPTLCSTKQRVTRSRPGSPSEL